MGASSLHRLHHLKVLTIHTFDILELLLSSMATNLPMFIEFIVLRRAPKLEMTVVRDATSGARIGRLSPMILRAIGAGRRRSKFVSQG